MAETTRRPAGRRFVNRLVSELGVAIILLPVLTIGCVNVATEHGDFEGEESGTPLTADQTYDDTRNGARLILAYDAAANSFVGTVENTTNQTLVQVRVEVHLSTGAELGPTTPQDLAPGEQIDVNLPATSASFESWSAHPEVG